MLRELAAPDVQVKDSAADLGTIFADLRNRKMDLFAEALMAPQLTAPPPTKPLQISFDLLFENVGGQRLFGISVQTPQSRIRLAIEAGSLLTMQALIGECANGRGGIPASRPQ